MSRLQEAEREEENAKRGLAAAEHYLAKMQGRGGLTTKKLRQLQRRVDKAKSDLVAATRFRESIEKRVR